MKIKISFLLFLLLVAFGGAKAQEDKGDSTAVKSLDSLMVDTTNTSKADDSSFDRPRLKLGVRFGVNFSDMIFNYEPLDRYEHYGRMFGLFGVFAEMPIGKTPLSLRPEVTMTSRGQKLKWLDVNYELMANYVDLRLPLTWNFRLKNKNISPYLMVAPELNRPYDGEITYFAEDFPTPVTAKITTADIKPFDFSLLLGLGVDFTIETEKLPIYVSLEGGYNLGLLNNFSDRERIENVENPSIILNNFFGAELWHGTRHTRGVELAMRVSLPVDGEFLKRYRDNRKHIPDTVVLVEKTTDTIIQQGDTIIVERTVEVPVNPRSKGYQTKECFTIAELYNLMDQGVDITGKRICMFNINFDFDSYKIRPESEKPLNELVRMMWDYPQMTIEVYGHTDSIGTAEYNQKLSENRAKAVVEYISNHGISPSRIKSFGYGLRYPIDTNSTEEGRFRNRRVEFEVITIGLNRKYNE